VVSAAFLARGRGNLLAGSDARAAGIFSRERLPTLAFDHERIIADALAPAKRLGLREADDQIKV